MKNSEELQDLRKDQDASEWRLKKMLEEQEKNLSEFHNSFLKDEIAKTKREFDQ